MNSSNIELSVFHLNIRSLNSKHRLLCQFLELLHIKFDVIILSEIWSNNISYYSNILPGYTFYYDLPATSTVGGVGIYVSNAYMHYEINTFKIDSSAATIVENIWIEIKKHSIKYIIGGIYRHPNKAVNEFCLKLDEILHRIASQNNPCIIAGDFNID